MPRDVPGVLAPSHQTTLNAVIEHLPKEDLNERTLVELTYQFLLDTPPGEYKHRLGALRLLARILKDRSDANYEGAMLEALQAAQIANDPGALHGVAVEALRLATRPHELVDDG